MSIINNLAKALKVDLLIKRFPELFDLDKLSVPEKIEVYKYNPLLIDHFHKPFAPNLDNNSRIRYLEDTSLTAIHDRFHFSEDEIKKMPVHDYVVLLRNTPYFTKYLDPKKIKKCGDEFYFTDLFMRHPIEIYEITKKLPVNFDTNRYVPTLLQAGHIKFVSGLNLAFNAKTNPVIWAAILEHDFDKHSVQFFKVFNNKRHASFIRRIIGLCPKLLEKLTVDYVMADILTPKEWILLVDRTTKINEVTLPPEVIKYLDDSVIFTVLSGVDKSSAPLSKALIRITQ
jgi:hypothetical protein